MAKEATLEVKANSKLRCLSARNKSLGRPEVAAGNSALLYKLMGRKSTPRCRRPATVLDIDEMRASVKFQGLTFRVERYCVRKSLGPKDLSDMDWNPASG